MSKQLLIYGQVQAVNKQRHSDWAVKADNNYAFAKHINSVPLTGVEFIKAAADYAIVFTGEGDNTLPLAVTGIRQQENLYINADGSIDADYIPAFLRRQAD